MKDIQLGNMWVGPSHPPLLVGEMSGNHNGILDRALAIVDMAKEAGFGAIKLQTYTADTMTVDSADPRFVLSSEKSLWKGKRLYDLYKEAYTPWEWHKPIFDRCQEHDLLFFSTPFDATAVDFLETLNVPCYKLASLEIQDLPLITKIGKTKKPLILSCGVSTLAEIDEAVSTARLAGCEHIILLKCVSAYPAPASAFNLKTLSHLSQAFDCPVGLSDHSMGIGVAVASISHGACLIEKHITPSRKEGGVDSAFSLDASECKQLAEEARRAWEAQGTVCYGPVPAEAIEVINRRSLYFMKDMQPGETITAEHIRAIRPGGGLSPKYLSLLIGCTVQRAILKHTPVTFDVLKK